MKNSKGYKSAPKSGNNQPAKGTQPKNNPAKSSGNRNRGKSNGQDAWDFDSDLNGGGTDWHTSEDL